MSQSNVYASVAGTVGRSDKDPGKVGVFRRDGGSGIWEQVISEYPSNVVYVHPTDPNIVFAGTHDGVYRSTDRGKTFKRANFPDKGMEIWSFLVDAGDPKLVYAGGSPVAVYRSEDSGETWRRLPDPEHADPVRDAVRLPRDAHGAAPRQARHDLRRTGSRRRDAHDRWRGELEGLQRRPDPPGAEAAPEEQDRQRHVERRHAGRARDRHQRGRSGCGDHCGAHGPVPHRGWRGNLAGHGGWPLLADHLWPRHPGVARGSRARSTRR